MALYLCWDAYSFMTRALNHVESHAVVWMIGFHMAEVYIDGEGMKSVGGYYSPLAQARLQRDGITDFLKETYS